MSFILLKKSNILLVIILLLNLYSYPLKAVESNESDSTRLVKPKAALIRSVIIPGWGQLYVHKPAKAVLYFSLEAYHLYNFFKYNEIYQYIKETKNTLGVETWNALSEDDKKSQVEIVTGYKLKLDSGRPRDIRNKYGWWCAAFYIANMLDALVDAHLYYFPEENIELTTDPSTLSIGMVFSWNLEKLNGD